MPHLEIRAVLAALQPPDVPRDLRVEALQPLLERRALVVAAQWVGVETDEAQSTAPGEHDVVIARVFVVCVVGSVVVLVSLNAEQRVADDTAVINPAPMVANAVRRGHRVVVHEAFEVRVDVGLDYIFCTLLRVNLLMVRKFTREATKTVIVVILPAYAPVEPVFTFDTS
jgi:hypothetical protein